VAAIAEPLLNVRRVMRQQLAVLHKMLLGTVRGDPVCRLLMTAPGVGAVVALTYRATVDGDVPVDVEIGGQALLALSL